MGSCLAWPLWILLTRIRLCDGQYERSLEIVPKLRLPTGSRLLARKHATRVTRKGMLVNSFHVVRQTHYINSMA